MSVSRGAQIRREKKKLFCFSSSKNNMKMKTSKIKSIPTSGDPKLIGFGLLVKNKNIRVLSEVSQRSYIKSYSTKHTQISANTGHIRPQLCMGENQLTLPMNLHVLMKSIFHKHNGFGLPATRAIQIWFQNIFCVPQTCFK